MELYNDSVANAIESWKTVQSLPNYRTLVGELLFREIFKLAQEQSLCSVSRHTVGVISRLESALAMMVGNDMENLASTLSDLGSKHIVYGVRPAHYLVVEAALVRTLQLGLKDQWTTSIKKDWAAFFKFMARAMMSGAENRVEIVKSTRRNTEHKKVATLRLKAITHSKRTGVLTRQSRSSVTSRFDGDKLRLPGRCSSEPPKRPFRGLLYELYDAKDDLDDINESDISSKGANTTRSMMSGDSDYWFWGDSSLEPPKMPQRKPLSTQDAVSRSQGQCPPIPGQVPFFTMNDSYSFQSVGARRARSERFPPSLYTERGTCTSIRFEPVHSLDKTPISPRRRRSPPRS